MGGRKVDPPRVEVVVPLFRMLSLSDLDLMSKSSLLLLTLPGPDLLWDLGAILQSVAIYSLNHGWSRSKLQFHC